MTRTSPRTRPLATTLVAPLVLALSGCLASDEDRARRDIESGDISITSQGPTEPVRSAARFRYAKGSTINLADNRFDTFAIEGELRAALESRLRARGITRDDNGSVDYLVGYQVSSSDQGRATDVVRTMGLQPRFEGEDPSLPRGTMVLVLADARTQAVVWRGTIQGAIDPNRSAQARKDRVDLAVELLLERLDPR